MCWTWNWRASPWTDRRSVLLATTSLDKAWQQGAPLLRNSLSRRAERDKLRLWHRRLLVGPRHDECRRLRAGVGGDQSADNHRFGRGRSRFRFGCQFVHAGSRTEYLLTRSPHGVGCGRSPRADTWRVAMHASYCPRSTRSISPADPGSRRTDGGRSSSRAVSEQRSTTTSTSRRGWYTMDR
jgi:hypothetical protein